MRHSKGARLHLREPRRPGGRRRWVILDNGPNGGRVEIGTGAFADDRRKAEKALADYLAKKHVPNFGEGRPDQVLIADVLAYYGERQLGRVMRQDTLGRSIEKLGAFFAGRTVNDITPTSCADYVQWRIGQGDARSNKLEQKEATPRMLKPTTARNDLIALQAAVRFAWQNRKLTHLIPVAKPQASEPRPRFLTTSEAARLLAAALGWDQRGHRHPKRINRHLARFILIALYTGTRKDRILRLQWVENLQGGWVDLDRGILHRRAPNEAETKKKAPSVPLADAPQANKLWLHLRRWRRLTARFVIEHNGVNIKHDIIAAFEGACELAGLDFPPDHPQRVTPHTLRHTCVTWLLADGKSYGQIGKYVGMSATMVERIYGHTNDDLQRETANAIGRRNIPGPVSQMSHEKARTSMNKRERARMEMPRK
jgi:integrase